MPKLKIKNFQQKLDVSKAENSVLDFWDHDNTFQKSIDSRPAGKPYVFYDGPPFATGLPHYGHILASTIKDVIPRYWTMKGHRVERVWGWDCHGIPIENIIEQELNLQGGKKGIETFGIHKFNAACRSAILRFDKDWEKIIRRMGRWVDFKNSYKTMDTSYMESVWWAFKTLYDKDLVYQGRKVILFCPRCSTPLSNFEIAMDNSYKDVEDYSIFVKFKIKDKPNEYFLAWTTTPWTLIGNVGLAVNPTATYVKTKQGEEVYYLAKDRLKILTKSYQTVSEIKGSDLEGIEYQPLYSFLDTGDKKAFYVATADFVSLEEGTGIVHTAAVYGEDDYQLATKLDLPRVPMLDDQGKYLDFVAPLAGQFYKKSEDWIVADLEKRNLMYRTDKLTHSVAFCYRCETQLYYNAVPAWFINIKKIKKNLLKQNEHINWYPGHLKHGRFGKGLETAPDWNISRSRYWGTPMPIWIGDKTGKIRVIGSIKDLKLWAVEPEKTKGLTDIHREYVDDIKVWVDDDKKETGTRVKEVFDCWVESGSMPYASVHYPFENKTNFESSFPAQFISEYIAQTRAWFYTLHVMAVGIFGKPAFQNVLSTGTILAEDGSKMSKSKKNFPDPEPLFEDYGVDALRFYLMGSPVMKAGNINFSEDGVKDTYQKLINILWNTFSFHKLYSQSTKPGLPSEAFGSEHGGHSETARAQGGLVNSKSPKPVHVLDQWIVSRTNSLIKSVTKSLDDYNTVSACRQIQEFVTDLSTWYLRRSRDRLRTDQISAQIFAWALGQLAQIMAPITPFISELIYQNLDHTTQSVHLSSWPQADSKLINKALESKMDLTKQIVETIHSSRQSKGIIIRQPLASATVTGPNKLTSDLIDIVLEETNIKSLNFKKDKTLSVQLDTKLTPALKAEGQARTIVRMVQGERKRAKINLDQQIDLTLPDWPQNFTDYIKQKTLAKNIKHGDNLTVKPL